MSRLMMTSLLVGGIVVAAAAQGIPPPPPQEGIPGRGTQARIYVMNRDRSEAIPVTVVTGSTVRIDPESVANARVVSSRQPWEYRTLAVGANDPTAVLNGAGADGWELTATIPGPGGTTQLVFKRPR